MDLGSALQKLLRQFDPGPDLLKWQNKDSIFDIIKTGSSVTRLSRLLWEQEAGGSNPLYPT